jgi:hypothetical protein
LCAKKKAPNAGRRVHCCECTNQAFVPVSDEEIVVGCTRGKSRHSVSILDLPLPDPPPAGAEWIGAFRRWVRRRQPWWETMKDYEDSVLMSIF